MNFTALVVALVGIVTTGGGGYLIGLWAGRRARRGLAAQNAHQNHQIGELRQALGSAHMAASTTARIRHEMQAALAPFIGEQQANASHLQEQMRHVVERVAGADRGPEQLDALRREVRRALGPMLERDREQKGLRELMVEVLSPLMEHERRAQSLKTLPASQLGREQLPALLDKIAQKGGFDAVLIGDEVGLPIAASARARDAEVLTGVSSLILTVADRVIKAGGPAPNAVLVRDDANQLTLHRIFSTDGERFLITATVKGAEIATTALDPALRAVEDMLAKTS